MKLSELKKVELHCHLEGIISSELVASIRHDWPDYPLRPTDLDEVVVHDYESFWEWWPLLGPLGRDLRMLVPVAQRYIDQLKRENVRYFELMISYGWLPKEMSAAKEALQAFADQIGALEEGAIQVEFLIANGRHHAENIHERADTILALYEAGLICGIAIAGPEPGFPVRPFQKVLARWHEAGLGIEIHAGEWVGAESVWDALRFGTPDRIGHGVALFDDPKLIEVFQERQIHVEMCPTSNYKTGSIKRLEDHPIRKARDVGLNFSVNTDDPGPFQCSMSSEYELLATTFDFTEADFLKIYENSLSARFQDSLRIADSSDHHDSDSESSR